MQITIYLIIDVILVLSALSLVFTLPGTWIMVATVAGSLYFLPSYTPYDWNLVWIVLGIAVVAEVLEFISSIFGVKKTGGSKRASWGALIGGIAGVIFGTPFVPPIGTFVGLFGGTFLGAYLMERDINPEGSNKVAFGAMVARFLGLMVKFLAAGSILTLVMYKQFLS